MMNFEPPIERWTEFGITTEQIRTIELKFHETLGFVLGPEATGGSGVFVETKDKKTGLLTASHVVIPAILGGEIKVGAVLTGKLASLEPISIRFEPRADIALLVLPEIASNLFPHRIPHAEWAPCLNADVDQQQPIVCVGIPGEFKNKAGLTANTDLNIDSLAWISPFKSEFDLYRCSAAEDQTLLPTSFKGMSGGPVFDQDGRLVGLITNEHRDGEKALFWIGRPLWKGIYHPFTQECDAPTDMWRINMERTFHVRHRRWKPEKEEVLVTLYFEYYFSPKRMGEDRLGDRFRTRYLVFGHRHCSRRFIVNIESPYFPTEDFKAAIRGEADQFFSAREYDISRWIDQ